MGCFSKFRLHSIRVVINNDTVYLRTTINIPPHKGIWRAGQFVLNGSKGLGCSLRGSNCS